MAKAQSTTAFQKKPKTSRKGVHAKTKTSKNKGSQNYKKSYKGQGQIS